MIEKENRLADSNVTTKDSRKRVPDFVTLKRQVQARCDRLQDGTVIGLTELSSEVGVDSNELIYWEKRGILDAVPASKGERSVGKYTLSEIKKAHYAHDLKFKYGWKPQEIFGAVTVLGQAEEKSEITPPAELTQVGRARMILAARLLARLAQLISGQSSLLQDCFLLARQLRRPDELPEPNRLQLVEKDEKQVLLLSEQKQSVTGISKKGEVLLYFKDMEKLREEAKGRTFLAAQLRGSSNNLAFELIYGFRSVTDNGQVSQLQQNLSLNQTQENFRFLLRLFHFLCVIVLNLEESLVLRFSDKSNVVEALVNTITLLAPRDRWSFAGFLTPTNVSALKVLTAGVGYPERLKAQLYPIDTQGSQIPSLPGWVFTHREHLIVENIAPNDPRLPDHNPEDLRAFAIIPAVVLDRVEGVIYVGSHTKLPEDHVYFDPEEIRLLYLLAQIIGEAQARERLTQAEEPLSSVPEPVALEQGEDELRQALEGREGVAETIITHARAGVGLDNTVVLLAVQLEGYGRLFTQNRIAANWFTQHIQRTLHHQLKHIVKDDWESPLPSRVFSLAPDQIVGLIGRTKENAYELRQRIGENLIDSSQLVSQKSGGLMVNVHVWSVHFAYRDLAQEFNLDRLTDATQKRLATHLLERTKGALKIVAHVKRADGYVRQRNYPAALTEYIIAESNEPDNPYVLRHKCLCLTAMGLCDEAIKYGEMAVERDAGYSGSHRRLGDAYLEAGKFEKAIACYQEAIKRADTDPASYLSLAESLILRGRREDLGRIIETLNRAMGCDALSNQTRAKYLRHKGEAYERLALYREAATWYEQALLFEPDNEELRWRLKKARHLAKNAEPALSSVQ